MSAKLWRLADPLDADALARCAGGSALPARADQPNPVTPGRQPAEDLEQMDLGPARMRVGPVLPVDEENVHATGGWSLEPAE